MAVRGRVDLLAWVAVALLVIARSVLRLAAVLGLAGVLVLGGLLAAVRVLAGLGVAGLAGRGLAGLGLAAVVVAGWAGLGAAVHLTVLGGLAELALVRRWAGLRAALVGPRTAVPVALPRRVVWVVVPTGWKAHRQSIT